MKDKELKEIARKIAEGGPAGDWYLLPPNSHGVIGYITDHQIGEIAYKGQPMNMQAAFEEAILQAFKSAKLIR